MSRFAVALLLICFHVGFVYGIDCTYGSNKNLIEHVFTTCPRITDRNDEDFCCYDLSNNKFYCCTAEEFALKNGIGIILPVTIAAIVVIALIGCCISCLCCSCCPWYRRRHGTIYEASTPAVQVIQSPANIPPSYTSQPVRNYYSIPPYPTGSTEMPQPPPYTNEAYAKQAPYNPAYLPSQTFQ